MPTTDEVVSWQQILAGFTRRNAGRRTVLEEEDPLLGKRCEELDMPLRGAAYDQHDNRIEIMLGEQGSVAQHLTRTIARPRTLELLHNPDGGDRGLAVRHGGAALTVLRFV